MSPLCSGSSSTTPALRLKSKAMLLSVLRTSGGERCALSSHSALPRFRSQLCALNIPPSWSPPLPPALHQTPALPLHTRPWRHVLARSCLVFRTVSALRNEG